MNTALQQLLGELAKADFFRDYLFRQPFSRSGVGEQLTSCGSWETLVEVVSAADADLLVVRQGERHTGTPPTNQAQLEQLSAKGFTILIRNAQLHNAKLQTVADDFTRDFHAPVNIHLYATPSGQWGFPWHYDAEEVFILQTAGRKQYSLRKNTVNPWPLEESLPTDMQYEREIMPLLRVELAAGDCLYIPGGWWHQAQAQGDEVALSLAIGVMPRTALDVLDFLREKLTESILWRQRLPISGEATSAGEEVADQYREMLKSLADDLQRQLQRKQMPAELQSHFRRDE